MDNGDLSLTLEDVKKNCRLSFLNTIYCLLMGNDLSCYTVNSVLDVQLHLATTVHFLSKRTISLKKLDYWTGS